MDLWQLRSTTTMSPGATVVCHTILFEVDVPFLGTASYTLSYVYAGEQGLSWSTKEARGAVRDIRGEYLLHERDDGTTEVTYRLAVDLGVLVPGFVRTQGSQRVIENALERLKARVEARSGSC